MNDEELNEAIKYNLDYLEGNYSIEEDLEETYKCLKETQQELDQYKNNWEELKKWLNEEYDHYDKYGSAPTGCAMGEIKRTLNKMKELEEDK